MCNDGPQLSVKWYYAQGNKQVGPVPTAELIRLFKGGELRRRPGLVQGMAEWVIAGNIDGLLPPVPPPLNGTPGFMQCPHCQGRTPAGEENCWHCGRPPLRTF